jgi:hypothetical protein
VDAVSAVVDHEDDDVAAAIGLVTVFGGLAIVGLPALAGPLQLPGDELGHWAGLSLPGVGQVVAAAAPAGAFGVTAAVVVKLSRVVLLVPAGGCDQRGRGAQPGCRPADPPAHCAAVRPRLPGKHAAGATGLVSAEVIETAATATTLLLAAALFGAGTTISIGSLADAGPRALALGGLRPPAGREVARCAARPGAVREVGPPRYQRSDSA